MKSLVNLLIVIALAHPCPAPADLLLARVSLDEATKQILNQGKSRVLAASTEMIDGREVHVIKVLTPDGHIQHHKIDAETGKEIS